jgi:putative endonuclease
MRNRHAAEAAGRRAEILAAAWLIAKGYRLLARRFSCHHGEIDLIVSRRHLIAFVEVKARPDLRSAMEAVSTRAQQRIGRAASLWLARNRPGLLSDAIRFDVVAVCPWRLPLHLRDAFRPDFA